MFTGPSTWREAALRQLCSMRAGSKAATRGLKNCYLLAMAGLMAEPPRYKLATQAGRWALAAVAEAASSAAAQVSMADDSHHVHGIQLALCRAFAHLAMEHTPGSGRCSKRWAKAERHCLASAQLRPKYEEGWVGLGRSQLVRRGCRSLSLASAAGCAG